MMPKPGTVGNAAMLAHSGLPASTVAPTLCGRSDAPMMATDAGSNRNCRLRVLMGLPAWTDGSMDF